MCLLGKEEVASSNLATGLKVKVLISTTLLIRIVQISLLFVSDKIASDRHDRDIRHRIFSDGILFHKGISSVVAVSVTVSYRTDKVPEKSLYCKWVRLASHRVVPGIFLFLWMKRHKTIYGS